MAAGLGWVDGYRTREAGKGEGQWYGREKTQRTWWDHKPKTEKGEG